MKNFVSRFFFLVSLSINSISQPGYLFDCEMNENSFTDNNFDPTVNCFTNSTWNNTNTHIPANQNMTPLTVKINFIFWQREDGIIGNFQENDPDHQYFIDEVIYEMNRRISNLVDPQNSACYNGTPDYLPDAKIRFDVKKYYIPDGYLWNIENATPNATNAFYCPASWDQAYTDLAYQRLAENNVRDGINVFFGTESSAFQALLIDQTTTDFLSVASTTNCSEWPGGQNDLNRLLRVEMTNEFLQYEYRLNFTQDPFWQLDFDALKYGLARSIVHELGHSFSLGHTFCNENVMNPAGGSIRNYFQSSQMGIMLHSLHMESGRQYVCCEKPGETPRILTGSHTWAFDTKVYTDIILEPGAELTICGNIYMPQRGVIHVKRGAKLIVDGGKISLNREEYDDCPDEFWGGIVVWGNSYRPHYEVDVDNLLSDDPGVVILENAAMIEYASLGINAFKYATSFPDLDIGDYFGGIIQADEATFKDCRLAAAFMPYAYENDSYFKNCHFFSDEGTANGGISAYGIFHLDIESCIFENLGYYGVRLINSGANIYNGCTFSEMTHGVYASATQFQTASIQIGKLDGSVQRNTFTQNTSGIYAFGLGILTVYNNDFSLSQTGLAVKGETQLRSYGNHYDQLTAAEHYEQSGLLLKTSDCNTFTENYYGFYVVGDNSGFSFDNNEFSDTDPNSENYDLFIREKVTSSGSITLGEIDNFQGGESGAQFNLFSDNAEGNSPQAGYAMSYLALYIDEILCRKYRNW